MCRRALKHKAFQVLEGNDIRVSHKANWSTEVNCTPPRGLLAVVGTAGLSQAHTLVRKLKFSLGLNLTTGLLKLFYPQ